MALFTPIDTVKDIMSSQGAKYWRVSDPQGGLLSSNYVVDCTLESSYNNLSALLDSLTGDYVVVKLFRHPPKKTGSSEGQQIFTYNVRLANSGNNNNRGPQQIQGYSADYVDMKIAMMKLEMENERLRQEAANPKTVDGINYEKEIIGFIKDWLTQSQIKNGLQKAAETKQIAPATDTPIEEKVEPGTIATMAQNVKAIMNGQTMDFFDSLAYFAKNDPETFKAQAENIINGVKAYKTASGQQ